MCYFGKDGRRSRNGFMEGIVRGTAVKAKIGSSLESAVLGVGFEGAPQ